MQFVYVILGGLLLFAVIQMLSLNVQEALEVAEINARYAEGGDLYKPSAS